MNLIQDAVKELLSQPEEIDSEEIVINSNIDEVVSLSTGETIKSGNVSNNKKKGRPVLHPFAGRVTLLRSEVEKALEDGPAFIEMMNKNHQIDETRLALLIGEGLVSTDVEEMFYTFQGSIEKVLEEVESINLKYKSALEDGTVSKIVNDYKKKRIVTNKDHDLYLEDTIKDGIVEKVEVHPNIIYGYVKVIIKK